MTNHLRTTRHALAVTLAAAALAAGLAAGAPTAGAAPAVPAQAATTVDPTTTTTGTGTTGTRPTTTVPPTATTRRGNELCAYRGQIPPRLWNLLERLFGLRCGPPRPTTTTTSTTTTRPGQVKDCGAFDTAVGWPTTFARPRSDCLLDAFATGTPARYVLYTSPAPGSGRRVTNLYEVIGVQRLRLTVDPTNYGGDTITVSECTGLTDTGTSLRATGCTVVETRPTNVVTTQTALVVAPTGLIVEGRPVTITATVAGAAGQPVTTGTVTLREGNDPRGTVAVDASGRATFTVTRPVGIWYFHAEYNGSPGFAPSTSGSVRFEVVPA